MKRNKLIGIVVIMCIAAICMTLFAGCKGAKLDTPDGLQYSDGMFSWNAVEKASGYNVSVNNKTEFYITGTSIAFDDAKLKGKLIDKQLNTLCVAAVIVDEEGNVKSSSDVARYEFDYVIPVQTNWTVTLDLNYADAPEAQTVTVKSGAKFDKPTDPQRSGWTFGGWYRDKNCLVGADFTAANVSNFSVTANMTLYAKWTADQTVTTTSVYFYSESWIDVKVKPYKGTTELFDGDGVAMAAVAGKANWFKANIDDTATSVIFTNGEDSTQSASFDKTKPYCKDGTWTASIPVDRPVDVTHEVTIKVGNGNSQQLSANPAVAGEYTIEVTLAIGDTVVITMDGKAASNYSADCGFTGTATREGKHTFFVSADRIWVDMPAAPVIETSAVVVINGDTDNAVKMQLNESPSNADVEKEYYVTVTLKEGDKIKILDGEFEFENYENTTPFKGTAPKDGEYTIYAKKYKDGGDSIWVAVPSNVEVTTTPTKVYFHNASTKWANVYVYSWKTGGNGNPGWPGAKMTSLGDNWYMLEIAAGVDHVIFNNNSGKQTDDLELEVVDGCAYYDFNGVTDDRPAE